MVSEQDTSQSVRWQQEIALYKEDLVRIANVTLNKERMEKLKSMRLSQLNNLLGVALEAQGSTEVQNWILYQMGRSETRRAWKDTGFGQAVLRDLTTIRGYAEEIVQAVYGSVEKRQRQQTDIALVRLYVGYLKRWFVARGGQR